jgi:transposase
MDNHLHFTNRLGEGILSLPNDFFGKEGKSMGQSTLAETMGPMLRPPVICQVGAIPLLYPILEELGLQTEVNDLCPSKADIDLGRLMLLFTLNRLMAPQPLYKVGEWANQTVLPQVLSLPVAQLYDNRLGRAMDALYPLIGEVWSRLVSRAVLQEEIDLSAVHWDTTSFYFEGAYEQSDLARYGYSPDQHSEAKRAKLGLSVTSRERLPLLYRLLAGNVDDRTTPVPHLQALLGFLSRPELTKLGVHPLLISDGKMVTAEAVATCHRYDWYYLGPLPTAETEVKALLSTVPDEELASHELSYRPQRKSPRGQPFIPYQGVWRSFTFTYQGQPFTDRALVVWSAGKARLDQQKRKTYLKRLLNGLDHLQRHLNSGKYRNRDEVVKQLASLQRGNPAKTLVAVDLSGPHEPLALHFQLNRTRLAAAQQLDGKYVLVTNAPHLSATEALAYFKAEDGVEKAVAGVKGPLQVRPVFLHTDERIEVLVFLNLVALLVRALLVLRLRRAGLTYSVDRVLFEFAPLTAVYQLFADGSQVAQLGLLTACQQEVLTALHLPAVSRYVTTSPLLR